MLPPIYQTVSPLNILSFALLIQWRYREKITHAGAIFWVLGRPRRLAIMWAARTMFCQLRGLRFGGGLSVMDFIKRTTLARMTPDALRADGPSAERLATSESLEAHGLSVTARLKHLNS